MPGPYTIGVSDDTLSFAVRAHPASTRSTDRASSDRRRIPALTREGNRADCGRTCASRRAVPGAFERYTNGVEPTRVPGLPGQPDLPPSFGPSRSSSLTSMVTSRNVAGVARRKRRMRRRISGESVGGETAAQAGCNGAT